MRTAIALFLAALLIRVAIIVHWQFDGLYGQDSFAYFQQAMAITENLPHGRLPPTDFFWPNGFPLLASLFMLVLGKTALAAQSVSLITGAALAPLAYMLAQELFPTAGPRAGLLAGLIATVAGQPILSSVVIMADMPALFWATLAAWLLVRAWRDRAEEQRGGGAEENSPRPLGSKWWLLGAGAALAMAIITRWLYVLLVPALGAYALYQTRRWRTPWWHLTLPALSSAGILLPQLWISLRRPEGLLHSWLIGWRPWNAFQHQFETVDGHLVYERPVGLFYAEPAGHPAYLFPLLGLAAVWGIWRLWQARAWGPLILLLGWSATVYLFLAGIPYENFRFGLTLYLPLVVLSGFGVSDLWGRIRPRQVVPAATILSLVGMLAWAYPMLGEFLATQNHSKVIARRVEQTLPPDATLLSFGLTLTLQHYTRINALELYYFDEDSLDELTRAECPVYLLLDVGSTEKQWQARPPDVSFRWLRGHATLTEVESFPPYTLLRVERDICTESPAFERLLRKNSLFWYYSYATHRGVARNDGARHCPCSTRKWRLPDWEP